MTTRYDIISDTHGYLSPELLEQLQGADVIVHAGDICSPSDYRTLSDIARVQMCLGNNDWAYDYGPMVKDRKIFVAAASGGESRTIASASTCSRATSPSLGTPTRPSSSATSGRGRW